MWGTSKTLIIDRGPPTFGDGIFPKQVISSVAHVFYEVVFSNIFYFHPYLGKWSNLTNIFFFQTTNYWWYLTRKMVIVHPAMFFESHWSFFLWRIPGFQHGEILWTMNLGWTTHLVHECHQQFVFTYMWIPKISPFVGVVFQFSKWPNVQIDTRYPPRQLHWIFYLS